MSQTAAFVLTTDVETSVIKSRLDTIWPGEDVDIFPDEKTGGVQVILGWYCGTPDENRGLRQAVEYLLSISRSKELFYLRDWESGDAEAPISDETLSVEDILRSDYRPAMHNGPHFRYRLR